MPSCNINCVSRRLSVLPSMLLLLYVHSRARPSFSFCKAVAGKGRLCCINAFFTASLSISGCNSLKITISGIHFTPKYTLLSDNYLFFISDINIFLKKTLLQAPSILGNISVRNLGHGEPLRNRASQSIWSFFCDSHTHCGPLWSFYFSK